MSVTYETIIKIVERSTKRLSVAVIYETGSHEWLPVDKVEYLRQLKLMSNSREVEYPCLFEVEADGEMFIHPRCGWSPTTTRRLTESISLVN